MHLYSSTLKPIEPKLAPGDRLHVPVDHDESICCSNDLWHQVWGCAIHISNFIVERTGHIVLNQEQREINDKLPLRLQLWHTEAWEIIYPDCIWSSAHGAFAPNALNSKEMNLRPRGKQQVMHSTFIPMDNPNLALCGMPQEMVFPTTLPINDPNYEYRGKPKGLCQILKERGLLALLITANQGNLPPAECKLCKSSCETQERLLCEAQATVDGQNELEGACEDVLQPGTSSTCCMQKCLSEQADFKAEKPLLQLTIEAAGHRCYFLLKFHCELNPIEMYWGWTKKHKVAADGTFPTVKRLVPEILDSCPVKTIHTFFFRRHGDIQMVTGKNISTGFQLFLSHYLEKVLEPRFIPSFSTLL
ncbi:hypothetical protein K439DRAFT_1648813 [Ramaria rubella]|nr:hypothetical protein K439DRAFT_1648813 [Ramaria rubella]